MTSPNTEKGFTLIEIMVTAAITMILAGLMIANLSRTRVDLSQVSFQVSDAVRQAESLTFAGALLPNGKYPCGYGVHFTGTSYTIFAAPPSDPVTGCPTSPTSVFTYAPPSGSITVISAVSLPNPNIVFSPVPPDIFFQPPLAMVRISDASNPAVITIRRVNAACPGLDCRIINVYKTRRIEQQ